MVDPVKKLSADDRLDALERKVVVLEAVVLPTPPVPQDRMVEVFDTKTGKPVMMHPTDAANALTGFSDDFTTERPPEKRMPEKKMTEKRPVSSTGMPLPLPEPLPPFNESGKPLPPFSATPFDVTPPKPVISPPINPPINPTPPGVDNPGIVPPILPGDKVI